MVRKKKVVETKAEPKAKPVKVKINRYKCDKCGTEFSVSELEHPVCTNPDCKSTCTQQVG